MTGREDNGVGDDVECIDQKLLNLNTLNLVKWMVSKSIELPYQK